MSTIAYRNGVMAADSMAYGGKFTASPGSKCKIHRITEGRFAGGLIGITSSCVGADQYLIPWANGGAEYGKIGDTIPSDFLVMIVDPEGRLWLANDFTALSGPIQSEFYAIGSGADFAIGAMAVGAGPERAIEVAIAHNQHTGGPVQALSLRGVD